MLDLYLGNIDLWTSGLMLTAVATIASISAGFVGVVPIGIALVRSRGILRMMALGYVNFFRGMPLLVLLFLIYYGLGQFNRELRTIGVWWFFRDAYYCGLLALVLNTAAYQGEIIRGGLTTISRDIHDVNAAFNLTRWTGFRRILFPMAMAKIMPALGNEFVLMLKATSLLSIITVFDLMGQARLIFSNTFDLRVYYIAAAHYLVLVLLLQGALKLIDRRYHWIRLAT